MPIKKYEVELGSLKHLEAIKVDIDRICHKGLDRLEQLIALIEMVEGIDDFEPLFILRAQDELAPEIIELYAKSAENAGVCLHKILGAQATAQSMRQWEGPKKLPD